MSAKEKLNNIKHVYNHKRSYFITILAALLIGIVFFMFTDWELIAGNMGAVYETVNISLQVLISILFGINIALLFHKIKISGTLNKRAGSSTAAGSILGMIVAGCPGCGISLASYLGLGAIFSTLPLFGMELKIAGVLLLAYSTNYLAKNMNKCKIKK